MITKRKPMRVTEYKRIPRVSKHRATQNQLYTKLKVKFLNEHPFCFVCNDTIQPKYRTLHHWAGRTGALLCWVPGFRMACIKDHQWIETHRNDAVKLGYRAPNNLFGRPSLLVRESDQVVKIVTVGPHERTSTKRL